jgi:hypothetical protein
LWYKKGIRRFIWGLQFWNQHEQITTFVMFILVMKDDKCLHDVMFVFDGNKNVGCFFNSRMFLCVDIHGMENTREIIF